MSVPGYDFCRIHGFGRMKGTPWYENGIFLALATTTIAVAVAWYFFSVGPSLENQMHILSKQDETVKATTNLPSQMDSLKNILQEAERKQAMAGKLDQQPGQHLPIISCGGARFCQFDPSETIFFDDGEPLLGIRRGEDGRVLLSAKIRNEKGKLIAEIWDNEWKLNPDLLFDRNYTNFAVEVRERTGNVVLQVADFGDVIHFEGILRCKNGRTFTVGREERGAVFSLAPNSLKEGVREFGISTCESVMYVQQ